MKVVCENCGAKYELSDRKVRGRRLKVRCKQCKTPIVVEGGQPDSAGKPSAAADADAEAAHADSDRTVWSVTEGGTEGVEMTTAQIVEAWKKKELGADHYVWKDGMDGWSPIREVAELQTAVDAAMEPTQTGTAEPQKAEPAKRKEGARGDGQDLFEGVESAGKVTEPPKGYVPTKKAGEVKYTGARDERSVLFDAEAFGKGFDLARSSSGGIAAKVEKEERASPDFGTQMEESPSPDAAHAPKGVFEGPSIDANPALLTTSVSEPPAKHREGKKDEGPPTDDSPASDVPNSLEDTPSPPPSEAASSEDGTAPPSSIEGPLAALSEKPTEPRPSERQLSEPPIAQPVEDTGGRGAWLFALVGLSAAVVALGAAAFILLRAPDPALPEGEPQAGEETLSEPVAEEPERPTPEPPPSTRQPESGVADEQGADVEEPTPKGEEKPTVAEKTSGTEESGPTAEKKSPEGKEPPTEKEKPVDEDHIRDPAPDPPSSSAPPFDVGAARAALSAAAASAAGCKRPDGPTGSGRVSVTFAPNGRVSGAVVSGAGFPGTAVGGCVASRFRRASVPAFSGGPKTVSKAFSVR